MTGPDNGPSGVENNAGAEAIIAEAIAWDAAEKEIDQHFGTQPAVKPHQSLIDRLLHRKPKADTLQADVTPLIVPPDQEEQAATENLPPQKRELLKKIGGGLKVGFKHWAQNLDPRGKDRVWVAGALFGVNETLFFTILAPLPGSSWVKAGINLAVSQGVYAGARVWHNRMIAGIEKDYRGKDLSQDEDLAQIREKRLANVESSYIRADAALKNFFMGVSAGATYTSAGVLLYSLGPEVAKSLGFNINLPSLDSIHSATDTSTTTTQETAPAKPTAAASLEEAKTGDRVPGASSPATSSPGAQAAPAFLSTEVAAKAARVSTEDVLGKTVSRISEVQHLDPDVSKIVDEALRQNAAALVGEHLAKTNEVANEAIKAMGVNPSQLSQQIFEQVRMTVQEEMQSQATVSFASVTSNNVQEVIQQGQAAFSEVLNTNAFHDQLLNEAKTTLIKETLKEKAASMVGEHLGVPTAVLDRAIENAGHDPSQLSEQVYEGIRQNIQGEIEKQVNAFDQNFDYSTAVSSGAKIDEIVAQAKTSFAESVEKSHEKLTNDAKLLVDSYLASQENVIKGIDASLKTAEGQLNTALVTEVTINSPTTVGQILVDHGYDLTSWGPDKAELFGAHIAANYDLLNSYWGYLAKTHNLPDGFHFPVSNFELDELIDQAKKGDIKALQKLKDALHWIPFDKRISDIIKFKVLSKAGVTLVTRSLP